MLKYCEVIYIEPDADFEQLTHKARQVALILVPLARKAEFLQSKGYKAF
jgi:hypothetical protein